MEDNLGRSIKVGDVVCLCTLSYKSAHIRVGVVRGFLNRKVTVQPFKRGYRTLHKHPFDLVVLPFGTDYVAYFKEFYQGDFHENISQES